MLYAHLTTLEHLQDNIFVVENTTGWKIGVGSAAVVSFIVGILATRVCQALYKKCERFATFRLYFLFMIGLLATSQRQDNLSSNCEYFIV